MSRSLVSLTYDGSFMLSGLRKKSTYSEIFSVGELIAETMGRVINKIGGSMVASCYPWLHRVETIRDLTVNY